jgi:RimJ/RimL family protein N-acetyltransferase
VDTCTDPDIRRYNSVPTSSSIADAEAAIEGFDSRWSAFEVSGRLSEVAFGIVDTGSGEPVGQCGVDGWSSDDVAQIGYWLAADARGERGYATRAVVLLTRWLFKLGAARVFLTIVAENDPSVAVARRAGFVYEGTMRSHGVWRGTRCDVLWFAALPLEWHPGVQAKNGSHHPVE